MALDLQVRRATRTRLTANENKISTAPATAAASSSTVAPLGKGKLSQIPANAVAKPDATKRKRGALNDKTRTTALIQSTQNATITATKKVEIAVTAPISAPRRSARAKVSAAVTSSAENVPAAAAPRARRTVAAPARKPRAAAASTSRANVEMPIPDEEMMDHPMPKRQRTSPDKWRQEMEQDLPAAMQAEADEDVRRNNLLVEVEAPGYVKDAGWQDLDASDADEPLMAAEYVVEIFDYMKDLEMQCAPNPNYMDAQSELQWNTRGILVDWLVEVHYKFRLLPETLFLAINLIDRFLSARCVSLVKLQLVGITGLFIASKYEEVLCPSVENLLHMSDGDYTSSEILKAEAYMLSVLDFDLSYSNPIHFLRRCSKADSYDVSTRTLAKFFLEISCVEHRLIAHAPSVVAAASIWISRLVMGSGEWDANLVHYSGYSEPELLPTAQLMLNYILRDVIGSSASSPPKHECFFKKYSSKKFLKAATHVQRWAQEKYPKLMNGPFSLEDEVRLVWNAQGRDWEMIPDSVTYRP